MLDLLKKYKSTVLIVVFIATTAVVSSIIVSERLEGLESTSRVQIAGQKALLATIAETTARNGADAITESIVIDCALDDRSRFDQLLGSLDQGLLQSELIELEQLFGACGSFFAERKAVMVARLSREIEIFSDQISLLAEITNVNEAAAEQLGSWQVLAENEQTQSVLFSNLVRLQKQIIDTLLEGKSATSPEIVIILNEVRETREALLLTKTQTDTLRANLTSL
jgi:hypothetical protein